MIEVVAKRDQADQPQLSLSYCHFKATKQHQKRRKCMRTIGR